ncbi:hypothetical protein J7K43_05585 [Candidatus Calescamantes bacterium]|nr:hypothetical protein [Candidatus Calescamantes bacterium]
MKILLKDGVKFLPHFYSSEDELTQLILEHPEEIFGEHTIFFPAKKIKAKSGIKATTCENIPLDAKLIITKIESKRRYRMEVKG